MQKAHQIRNIILTGDDGYNSAGTRLLIHILRKNYKLQVIGTRHQQSAVGGKISLADGFQWCETTVDDIPALCVDGTPADCTELAAAYFDEPFDLAISGVNWGVNMGTAVFGSGTVNAALRMISVKAAKKAIAVSWDLPPEFYIMAHENNHDIEQFLEYPGKILAKLLEEIFAANFWGVDLLNINLPFAPTTKVKFAEANSHSPDIYDYSRYSVEKGKKEQKQHLTYTNHRRYDAHVSDSSDVKAVTDKYISISPCRYDLMDSQAYQKYKDLQLDLAE
jgi:5'-nucleotidase